RSGKVLMTTRLTLGPGVLAPMAFRSACRSSEPSIAFSLVPVADPGGPESLEAIRGSARKGTAWCCIPSAVDRGGCSLEEASGFIIDRTLLVLQEKEND